MKKITMLFLCAIAYFTLTSESGCNVVTNPESASGVKKANFKIQTDLSGKTVEQNAIIGRMTEDNKPGSIKHLYIISAYSGQVLIYSTVKGKVTSSGKRLTPSTVDGGSGISADGDNNKNISNANRISIGSNNYVTDEVLGDDGTYGPSVEYVYWWDSKNIYHQQYITGGMIMHISNQPLAVKSIVLNLETSTKSE